MADMTLCSVATCEDAVYIRSLQDENRESVGHLPRERIDQQIGKRRVTIGRLNGDPFGYMLFHGNRDLIVSQACIQYDARRRLYGAELTEFSFSEFKPERIRLKCAADLESNLFWRAIGFTCVGQVKGGRRRGRKINIWMRWNNHSLFSVDELSMTPLAELRTDCKYDTTDYLVDVPDGFSDGGSLGRLSWKTDY